jgi:hypothetical protein
LLILKEFKVFIAIKATIISIIVIILIINKGKRGQKPGYIHEMGLYNLKLYKVKY